MTEVDSLAADYDLCRRITERCGRNFNLGFRELPEGKRQAVYAAYAFCRLADDIADEPRTGGADREHALALWADELEAAYTGTPRHPVGRALADSLHRFEIPRQAFADLIEGCRHDLSGRRYRTYEQLLGYCDLVAVPIGAISLSIFGLTDRTAVERGRQLSVALQLTNILRDVREDAQRDRVYLPLAELEEFDVTPDQLARGQVGEGFEPLMRRTLARAHACYQGAASIVTLVEPDAHLATQLMGSVYVEVLRRIDADPFRVLRERVVLTESEKQALVDRHRRRHAEGLSRTDGD